MNQINDLPGSRRFGLDFDYAVWTANSHITLTNVPWNNDYRDAWAAKSTDDLNNYIDRNQSENVVISNSVYAKVNEPIRIETPFNVASMYNYVRVFNPAQPVMGNDRAKYFYYFVTDVQYIAPNTTQITVQLDIFQTYIRSVTFGRCYVEQGHAGIANEDGYRNYGADFLTVPEGLDTGSEYMVVDRKTRKIMGSDGLVDSAYVGKSVIVGSTVDLEAKPGTVNNPNLSSASGGEALGVVSGASFYLFKREYDFRAFMDKYRAYPWITQSIISINIIPDYRRYWTEASLGSKLAIGGYRVPPARAGQLNFTISKYANEDFRTRKEVLDYIPVRYRHLRKFLTFPYMAVRISSNTGQQVILQPERWNSDMGNLREMAQMMPPGTRVSVLPDYYNSRVNSAPTNVISGDGMDRAVSIGNFPSLPIVNNGAILYMAQNAHSMTFGARSADWSQQKALRGNDVSYDQATAATNAAGDMAQIGMNADMNSTALQNDYNRQVVAMGMLTSTGMGAAGGALAGGPAGAVVGAAGGLVNGGLGIMSNNMSEANANAQLANRLSATQAGQDVSANLANYNRDTNKTLADWAAKGDYANAIAGLNAKTRDAQLSPPSLSGQQGGELFNYVNNLMEFRVEILMPDQASLQISGEYWLRYGYQIQRFMQIPPSLMVMTKFTYWKMKETYIKTAPMPETIKQGIRGMFEKGITLWNDPDEMGMIDPAVNKPVKGFKIDGYIPPTPLPEPDPEAPDSETKKKRNRKMLVYSSIDNDPVTPGSVWALAGTSPGSDANWIETRDSAQAEQFIAACSVDDPVGLRIEEFRSFRDLYRKPVSVVSVPGTEA